MRAVTAERLELPSGSPRSFGTKATMSWSRCRRPARSVRLRSVHDRQRRADRELAQGGDRVLGAEPGDACHQADLAVQQRAAPGSSMMKETEDRLELALGPRRPAVVAASASKRSRRRSIHARIASSMAHSTRRIPRSPCRSGWFACCRRRSRSCPRRLPGMGCHRGLGTGDRGATGREGPGRRRGPTASKLCVATRAGTARG